MSGKQGYRSSFGVDTSASSEADNAILNAINGKRTKIKYQVDITEIYKAIDALQELEKLEDSQKEKLTNALKPNKRANLATYYFQDQEEALKALTAQLEKYTDENGKASSASRANDIVRLANAYVSFAGDVDSATNAMEKLVAENEAFSKFKNANSSNPGFKTNNDYGINNFVNLNNVIQEIITSEKAMTEGFDVSKLVNDANKFIQSVMAAVNKASSHGGFLEKLIRGNGDSAEAYFYDMWDKYLDAGDKATVSLQKKLIEAFEILQSFSDLKLNLDDPYNAEIVDTINSMLNSEELVNRSLGDNSQKEETQLSKEAQSIREVQAAIREKIATIRQEQQSTQESTSKSEESAKADEKSAEAKKSSAQASEQAADASKKNAEASSQEAQAANQSAEAQRNEATATKEKSEASSQATDSSKKSTESSKEATEASEEHANAVKKEAVAEEELSQKEEQVANAKKGKNSTGSTEAEISAVDRLNQRLEAEKNILLEQENVAKRLATARELLLQIEETQSATNGMHDEFHPKQIAERLLKEYLAGGSVDQELFDKASIMYGKYAEMKSSASQSPKLITIDEVNYSEQLLNNYNEIMQLGNATKTGMISEQIVSQANAVAEARRKIVQEIESQIEAQKQLDTTESSTATIEAQTNAQTSSEQATDGLRQEAEQAEKTATALDDLEKVEHEALSKDFNTKNKTESLNQLKAVTEEFYKYYSTANDHVRNTERYSEEGTVAAYNFYKSLEEAFSKYSGEFSPRIQNIIKKIFGKETSSFGNNFSELFRFDELNDYFSRLESRLNQFSTLNKYVFDNLGSVGQTEEIKSSILQLIDAYEVAMSRFNGGIDKESFDTEYVDQYFKSLSSSIENAISEFQRLKKEEQVGLFNQFMNNNSPNYDDYSLQNYDKLYQLMQSLWDSVSNGEMTAEQAINAYNAELENTLTLEQEIGKDIENRIANKRNQTQNSTEAQAADELEREASSQQHLTEAQKEGATAASEESSEQQNVAESSENATTAVNAETEAQENLAKREQEGATAASEEVREEQQRAEVAEGATSAINAETEAQELLNAAEKSSSTNEAEKNEEVATSIEAKKQALESYIKTLEQLKSNLISIYNSEKVSGTSSSMLAQMALKTNDYVQGNGLDMFRAVGKVSNYDVIAQYQAMKAELEQCGYTLSELTQESEVFATAQIVPLENAITNYEEFVRILDEFKMSMVGDSEEAQELISRISVLDTAIATLRKELAELNGTAAGTNNGNDGVLNKKQVLDELVDKLRIARAEAERLFTENFGNKAPYQIDPSAVQELINKQKELQEATESEADADRYRNLTNMAKKYYDYVEQKASGVTKINGSSDKSVDYQINAVERLDTAYADLLTTEGELTVEQQRFITEMESSSNFEAYVQRAASSFDSIQDKLSKLSINPNFSEDLTNQIATARSNISTMMENVTSGIENVNTQAERIAIAERFAEAKKEAQELFAVTENISSKISVAKLGTRVAKDLTDNSGMLSSIKTKYQQLAKEIDVASNSENTNKQTVQDLTLKYQRLELELEKSGVKGKSMADQMKASLKTANAQLVQMYLSWFRLISYVKEMISTIVELDDALVDLKKTTSMNSEELETFYYNAPNIAKEMGVTTEEIISQAAAWSRLGYSAADTSTQMAQLSSQFASISPGMDTDTAQTGLVSIMKAFDIDTDDVQRQIMDNINVLGNSFAETNEDIVEGMEKSAATLSALGQSAEDSFALFTGAQEVIQNAETVGTALKTLSLRIRGYDEETEELSDDVIEATGEVADLTKTASNPNGISLWADADQTKYKSMVEYLGEIADEWDEISAKNQTALLENLFGKRGASVGTAILGNFDAVEESLTKMENAAGSADSEMDTIRDSISYKWNAFVQTWVGYLEELLNRGDLGELVDNLTKFAESFSGAIEGISPVLKVVLFAINSLVDSVGKLVDAFGPLSPWITVGAVTAYKNISKIKSAFLGIESVVIADEAAVARFTKQLNTVGFEKAFSNNLKGASVATLESAKMNVSNQAQIDAINAEIVARKELDAQKLQAVGTNSALEASEASYTGQQLTSAAATAAGANADGTALLSKVGLTEADFTEGEVLGTTISQKIAAAEATGELSIAEGNLLAQTLGLNTSMAAYSEGAILLNTSELTRLSTETKLSEEEFLASLSTDKLALSNGELAIAAEGVNAEELKQIINSSSLSKKNKALALSFFGIQTAEEGAAAGGTILNGVFNTLKAHPIIAAISAIVLAIEILPRVYDALTTSEEEITEAANTAKDNIDELKSSLESTKETTNDIAQSFAELAQQVGNLGTLSQNQGSLDTDDYETFLDYSNQLAELYPTLVKGYDDAGNAILNLNGDASTIVSTLNDLLDVEENITRQQIIDQIPDYWAGYAQNMKNYNSELETNQELVDGLNSSLTTMEQYYATGHKFSLDLGNNAEEIKILQASLDKLGYSDLYSEDGYSWDGKANGDKRYTFDLSGLSSDEFSVLEADLKDYINTADLELAKLKGDAQSATSEMMNYIQSWLDQDWEYTQLSDNMKLAATTALSSTDWLNSLPEDVDKADWDAVQSYLHDDFLYALDQISPDMQDTISEALTGEITINGLAELYTYLDENGFSEDNPLFLYIKTQYEEATAEEQEVYDYFTNQTGNEGVYIKQAYRAATAEEQAVMQTEEFKEAVENDPYVNPEHDQDAGYVYTVDDIMAIVDGILAKRAADTESEFVVDFDKGWNSLESDDQDKLKDLAKSGEISNETLTSTEDYNSLLEAMGDDADATKKAIYGLLTETEKLGAASQGMDDMKDAYDEWKDDGFVTAETLTTMADAGWKDLDSWDSFEDIMGDPTKAATQGQEAINTLVSEYLKTLDVLADANDDTKNTIIANLKEIGITNAEEYVNSYIQYINQAADAVDEVNEKMLEFNGTMQAYDELENYSSSNGFDFIDRPIVSAEAMQEFYPEFDGDYATYYSSYGDDEIGYVLMTPILPNGDVLEPDALAEYAEDALAGNGDIEIEGTEFTVSDITMGNFDSLDAADEFAEKVHELSEIITSTTEATEDETAAFLQENFALDENTAKKIANKIANFDASTATDEETASLVSEINALLTSAGASDTARVACFALVAQETIFANTDLSGKIASKISALNKLALAYGVTADAASLAATKLRLEDAVKNGQITSTEDYNNFMNNELSSNYNTILSKISAATYSDAGYSYTTPSYTAPADSSSSSSDTDETEETFDWIEIKLDRLQSKIDKLDDKASDTWRSWSSRNKSLIKELTTLNTKYETLIGTDKKYYTQQAKNLVKNNPKLFTKSVVASIQKGGTSYKNTNAYKNASEEDRKKMDDYATYYKKAQAATPGAADYYKSKASSYAKKVGLSESLQKKVQNGSINISDYSDETADKIKQYQDYWESYQDALEEEEDTLDDIFDKVQALFDEAEDRLDSLLSKTESESSFYTETTLNKEEATGGELTLDEAAKTYYKNLNAYELTNRKNLRTALKDEEYAMNLYLAKGGKKTDQEYIDMETKRNNTQQQLAESYNNTRKNYYEIFQSYLESVQKELEQIDNDIADNNFAMKVFEQNGPLVDKDSAGFTTNGLSTLQANENNLADYNSQLDTYYAEREKIQKYYNTGKISYEEYVKQMDDNKANIESVGSNIIETQNSIKSLWEQMYSQLMDNLNELIETETESLQTEKDSYDYQKSIQEKSDQVASYRKQLLAYSGDTSEENSSRLQQLSASLKDAEEDLYETEWDKYISETTDALKDVADDMQEWIDDRLDDVSTLLKDTKTLLTESGGDFNKNLQSALTSVFGENGSKFYDTLTKGLSGDTNKDYETEAVQSNLQEKVDNTKVKTVDSEKKAKNDKAYVKAMLANQNSIDTLNAALENAKAAGVSEDSEEYKNAQAKIKELQTENSSLSKNGGNNKLEKGDHVLIKKDTPYFSKATSEEEEAITLKTNRTGVVENAKETNGRVQIKLDGGESHWFDFDKKNKNISGYATGSKHIDEDQMAWTQEQGQEVIFRKSDGAMLTPLGKGDAVFTAEQTSVLWDLSKGALNGFATGAAPQVSVPASTYNGGNVNVVFDGGISMHGVNDPQTFAKNLANALNNDKNIKSIITSNTLGVAMGKNSLNGRRYS